MKKYLFVIARYKDERQDLFEKYISPKNKLYCKLHNLEYLEITNNFNFQNPRENPTWLKFYILDHFLETDIIRDGDCVLHFDADMIVVKPEYEYMSAKSFSYAIDSCNSHCMGNFCMNINDWSLSLIKNILSEEAYEFSRKSRFGTFFREQAVWYFLAGIDPSPKSSFLSMDNYGFNSKPTEISKYTTEDLLANVEIKGQEWNVTLLKDEIDNRAAFNMRRLLVNHTDKKDMIIRHFAGRQPWRKEYL